ncbi:MAG: diguanylate cyclase domain-containing protein, partial [Pleurocapsa sp.]
MDFLAEHQLSKKILIVDDTPDNLQLLLLYLKNAGYKILIAQDGKRAIKTAAFYQPDLILLDVMMPGLDGFSTCSHLKNKASTKDIPIIFMTALAETENKIRGFELGAVDYITKPINQDELLARIKTHLSLQDLQQRLVQDMARQKLLLEISDRIRQCLDLKSILTTAAKEIRVFLNCDSVWLAHLDNKDISLEAFAHATDIKIDQSTSWDYFCDHQEEYLADRQGNIRVVNPIKYQQGKPISPLNQPIRIVVPILINSAQPAVTPTKNNILWGWLIINYREASQWQAEEIKLLTVLTTQLAIGIKQALLYEQLTQQVSIDYLTQVYNRRHFTQQLNLEWRRLRRTSSYLSLIMCDVDYFKLYNDTYGHQQGDECLQQVAKAISTAIKRPGDIVARYGGEEFAVILPQTSQSGAVKVAEAMKKAVKNLNIPHL